jgi:hypothetical protein
MAGRRAFAEAISEPGMRLVGGLGSRNLMGAELFASAPRPQANTLSCVGCCLATLCREKPATLPGATNSGSRLKPHAGQFIVPALCRVVGSMGHFIFDIMMGFISFGSVAILIASFVGLVIWILSWLIR